MTGPHLTDTELPLVSDVIDAIHAAATGDQQAIAVLIERLTDDHMAQALALALGMAGGIVAVLADMTRSDPDEWIRYIRQRAAA